MLENILALLLQKRLVKSAEKHIDKETTFEQPPSSIKILEYAFFLWNQLAYFVPRQIISTLLSKGGFHALPSLSETILTDRFPAIELANAIAPLTGPVGTKEGISMR